jgi:predicted Zn-dependent protease
MPNPFRVVLLCLAGLSLAGCSTNPATGEQSFTAFMSPSDEMRVGAEEHPKILKQFNGAYGEGEMAAYASHVGRALARVSEVTAVGFTFTVLNTDKVNAFALPGGYVYITRGLLALADDEAEMASVLAHEIGHVAARHTAQRYSRTMAANLGLTVLGVLGSVAGAPPGLGEIASLGTQAALQGFSREQEMEADMLGARYLARAGYDLGAMSRFLGKLQQHDRLEAALTGSPDPAARFNIMSTHPRTADRIAQAIRLAGAAPVANARRGRSTYLTVIDGLLFGDDPKEGVRKGRDFAHPGLGIRFTVPPGYVLFNSSQAVIARGPGKAVINFDMESSKKAPKVGDLAAYLRRDWGRSLSLGAIERITVNGMEAATGRGRANTRDGTMDVRLVALRDARRRIFRLAFLTRPALTASQAEALQRTTYSFRLLSADEAAAIRPLRLRVVTVGPGDTAGSLADRLPFEKLRLEWFETLNGLAPGQPLAPGSQVKIVAE